MPFGTQGLQPSTDHVQELADDWTAGEGKTAVKKSGCFRKKGLAASGDNSPSQGRSGVSAPKEW